MNREFVAKDFRQQRLRIIVFAAGVLSVLWGCVVFCSVFVVVFVAVGCVFVVGLLCVVVCGCCFGVCLCVLQHVGIRAADVQSIGCFTLFSPLFRRQDTGCRLLKRHTQKKIACGHQGC